MAFAKTDCSTKIYGISAQASHGLWRAITDKHKVVCEKWFPFPSLFSCLECGLGTYGSIRKLTINFSFPPTSFFLAGFTVKTKARPTIPNLLFLSDGSRAIPHKSDNNITSTTMSNNHSNQWIGDHTDGGTLTCISGNHVVVQAAKPGTPYNVRSKTSATSDFCHFTIKIQELQGTVAVGLVSESEFLPGWKTRGMFYNGNVTNGSAALYTSFGKFVAAGDTVGVRIFRNNDATEVQFLVNSECLGTAFRLNGPEDGKYFYPCVHVSGKAEFVYQEIARSLSEALMEDENSNLEEAATFQGDWKILSFQMDGESMSLPEGHDIIVNLGGEGTHGLPTTMSVKVVNTLRSQLTIEKRGEDALGGPGAWIIQMGPVMSTMMMPRPPLDAIERTLTVAIPKLTKLTLALGHLFMAGDGMSFPEMTASRYRRTFEPLTKY